MIFLAASVHYDIFQNILKGNLHSPPFFQGYRIMTFNGQLNNILKELALIR